jgi:hypothetical protein
MRYYRFWNQGTRYLIIKNLTHYSLLHKSIFLFIRAVTIKPAIDKPVQIDRRQVSDFQENFEHVR